MNEEIIGVEVSGEIYPIKDEETSGKAQTLETNIQELKSLVDTHEEEIKELTELIDDTITSNKKTWSSEKINNNLINRVPFRFGITEDGQYGYYEEGTSKIIPFKDGSANFIDIYVFQNRVTLSKKGNYIISATSYSGSGSSTARFYTELKTISDGIFEQLAEKASNGYSQRAYKVTTFSDNAICTFGDSTNVTVTKIE